MNERGRMDVTPIVDRGGRRVRYYERKSAGPSNRTRRERASEGLKWCRRCEAWMPVDGVRAGLCREHQNELYRENYHAGGRVAIAARVHARKRGVAPVPTALQVRLSQRFGGKCAYCAGPADTWDHVEPISKGGETVLWNVVPACASCNASKGNRPLASWLQRRGMDLSFEVIEVLIMREVAL